MNIVSILLAASFPFPVIAKRTPEPIHSNTEVLIEIKTTPKTKAKRVGNWARNYLTTVMMGW